MIHGHCYSAKPRSSGQKAGTPGSGSLLVTCLIGVRQGSECRAIVPGYYVRNLPPLGFHKCPAGPPAIANSRANGYCPEVASPREPSCLAALPREESTVTAEIVGIPDCPPGPPLRAVRQLASSPCAPCGVARLGACGLGYCLGGFRAPALPLRSFSDRHVLCSFVQLCRS